MRPEQSQESRNRPSTNGSSQNGSSSHTNGSFKNGDEEGSSATNGVHLNGESHLSIDVLPHADTPFYGHDREEVTRILLQALKDLGYRQTAMQLCDESGYEMEIASVAAFRGAVQRGDWEEAELLLFGSGSDDIDHGGVIVGNGDSHPELSSPRSKSRVSWGDQNGHFSRPGLPLAEGADVRSLKFLLRQQKYLELLERRELNAAMSVLRNELTPLRRDTGRIHALSRLLMCPSADDLRSQAGWTGSHGSSRSLLLSEVSKSISPSVMIPEHRLATLFTSVQHKQSLRCRYHNTTARPSLYTDHECASDDFPLRTLTELRHHSDEVWCLEFSHDGSLLATGGREGLVCVYGTQRWRLKYEFREHERSKTEQLQSGICHVAFSPDDQYLISCSMTNEVVVISVKDGRRVVVLDHYAYPPTSAVWLPDSQNFIIGSQDSLQPLSLHGLRSSNSGPRGSMMNIEIRSFRPPPLTDNAASSGFRVSACAISTDGKTLAAATTEGNRVLLYDIPTARMIADYPLEYKIMSLAFAPDDSRELLVSMNQSHLCAMSTVTGEVLMEYEGARRENIVIRSSYGGAEGHLVLSGSEDSTIHIWRRETGRSIAIFDAHAPRPVNAVAWHPTNPGIFASAGDDRRVRIWASANALLSTNLAAPTSPSLEAADVILGQRPSHSNLSLPAFNGRGSSFFSS